MAFHLRCVAQCRILVDRPSGDRKAQRDARHDRRRAAAQPARHGDLVLHRDPHARQLESLSLGRQPHGAEDQVLIGIFRELRRAADAAASCQGARAGLRQRRGPHAEVNLESEAQAVEARAQICGGRGDADFK